MRSVESTSRIVGRLLRLVPVARFAEGSRLLPRTRSILGALLALVAGNKRLVPEFLPHLLQVTAALPGTAWMDDVDLSTAGLALLIGMRKADLRRTRAGHTTVLGGTLHAAAAHWHR